MTINCKAARSAVAVRSRKYERWTIEEDGLLDRYYQRGDMTNNDIAVVLNRSYRSVSNRIVRLGLAEDQTITKQRTIENRTGEMRRWTNHEVRLLMSHYPNMDCDDIAAILDRTTSSVVAKVSKLGLRKS